VEIGVIDVSNRSATEVGAGLGGLAVVNTSRIGAPTDTSGVDQGVSENCVAFGPVTPARERARGDTW
jgi:hypothetical protein